MDLPYFDKLAKDKRFKGNIQNLLKCYCKNEWTRKIWVYPGTVFAGEIKIFCNSGGIKIYSTMSETKAAFAERIIRSLKNILYRYKEVYGYKYFHKLPQLTATMNSRNIRIIDMKPNRIKDSDFISMLYSKTLGEYKKTYVYNWRPHLHF